MPLRTIEPEPWSLGVRFQQEPEGLLRYEVAPESPAANAAIDDLPLGEDTWISFIVRDDTLVPIQAETRLRPGDEVVVLSGDTDRTHLDAVFTLPQSTGNGSASPA